ncbi:MAG: hypothetical protein M3273_04285 [Actinomycetota bacterium]|nr:hypothetical protein [Actinomycetota bacterium]
MRKLIAFGTAAVLLAAPVQSAVAGKPAHQHVEGTIAIPQGGGPAATCVYRVQRTLMIIAGSSAPNGVFGYTFDVDPGTVGKPFKLDAGAGAGMDISFYAELGAADPTVAPANVTYETPGPGGEKGTVPAGYPIAFVCMTEGVNGSFSYMAGKGVK